jgi:glycine/D-amino acid oxidase-like deaminating enzyme
MPDCNQLVDQKIMIWNTADPYLYMRQTSDQRILIGGRDEPFVNAKKREALIVQKSKQLENDFKKLFPDHPFAAEFRWTGTFGTTKDGLPYIGADKNRNNVFYALGFGGNGITFSLIAAQILSDHFRGRKNKDAWIFDFNR